jgi:hypothetical protein
MQQSSRTRAQFKKDVADPMRYFFAYRATMIQSTL